MKKTITLLALASIVSCLAFATEASTDSQKLMPHSPATSLATYEKVARENETLKAEVARLADANEELKSQIAYQTMMANMLLTLKQQEAEDKKADLEATLAYDDMMGKMFTHLQQKTAENQKEDTLALVAYNSMMENMFRKIGSTPNR